MTSPFAVVESREADCPTHGAYTAMLIALGGSRWTGCPTCAQAEVAARNTPSPEEQRRLREASRHARLREAGVPTRALDATFSSYEASPGSDQAQVLAKARRYGENASQRSTDGDGLILMGKVGTGKTHLACAILRAQLLIHGRSGRYITAMQLMDKVRDSYGRDDVQASDILTPLARTELLVIDEIGATKASEHDLAILTALLSERHEECRGTILVTNLPADQLRDRLGDRVTDRVRQTCEVLVFDWESKRGADA